jgi:hypothetical protein
VPLAIFDQSQKTAAGSGVGMFRDKLLAKWRVVFPNCTALYNGLDISTG